MANLEVFKHTYTTATHSSHVRAGGTKSVDRASQCKGAAVCHSRDEARANYTALHQSALGDSRENPCSIRHPAPPAPIPKEEVQELLFLKMSFPTPPQTTPQNPGFSHCLQHPFLLKTVGLLRQRLQQECGWLWGGILPAVMQNLCRHPNICLKGREKREKASM